MGDTTPEMVVSGTVTDTERVRVGTGETHDRVLDSKKETTP